MSVVAVSDELTVVRTARLPITNCITWNANQPGEFNDLCNVITITSSDAQVDLQQDSDEPGSWDPGTETLTMPWYDATNDFEDVSVLTRN